MFGKTNLSRHEQEYSSFFCIVHMPAAQILPGRTFWTNPFRRRFRPIRVNVPPDCIGSIRPLQVPCGVRRSSNTTNYSGKFDANWYEMGVYDNKADEDQCEGHCYHHQWCLELCWFGIEATFLLFLFSKFDTGRCRLHPAATANLNMTKLIRLWWLHPSVWRTWDNWPTFQIRP